MGKAASMGLEVMPSYTCIYAFSFRTSSLGTALQKAGVTVLLNHVLRSSLHPCADSTSAASLPVLSRQSWQILIHFSTLWEPGQACTKTPLPCKGKSFALTLQTL